MIGDCGYVVGERGYFERINKESGLSDIIHFSPSYHYYDGIRDFCDDISSVISDVYSDAKNNSVPVYAEAARRARKYLLGHRRGHTRPLEVTSYKQRFGS